MVHSIFTMASSAAAYFMHASMNSCRRVEPSAAFRPALNLALPSCLSVVMVSIG